MPLIETDDGGLILDESDLAPYKLPSEKGENKTGEERKTQGQLQDDL